MPGLCPHFASSSVSLLQLLIILWELLGSPFKNTGKIYAHSYRLPPSPGNNNNHNNNNKDNLHTKRCKDGSRQHTKKEPLALLELLTNLFSQHAQNSSWLTEKGRLRGRERVSEGEQSERERERSPAMIPVDGDTASI